MKVGGEEGQVPVSCNGYMGVFMVARQRIVCSCEACERRLPAQREFSCTQFEVHAGAGAAKKWKASIRVQPGAFSDVPASAPHISCPHSSQAPPSLLLILNPSERTQPEF